MLGRILVRGLVGALFVGHGTQKLFGWFDGAGPAKTGETFESAGLHPGRRNALAAGATEVTGGALLAAGLATPLASSLLSGVMLTAIRTVHREKGVWNADGGAEYPAVVLVTLFALTERGPGRLSLDGARGRGTAWAFAQLAAAEIASRAIVRAGRREAVIAAEESVPAPEREPLRQAA